MLEGARLIHMQLKPYHIFTVVLFVLLAQASILLWLDHAWICSCGVKIWDGSVRGPQNSQHIFDWYSVLHGMYGVVLYFAAWFLHNKFGWKMSKMILGVLLISFAWEIFENTHYVISHYQVSEISPDYYGDSVINSISDTLSLLAGFSLAFFAPVWASVILFVIMLFLTTFILRDNIFINTFLFFFPNSSLLKWQGAASIYH